MPPLPPKLVSGDDVMSSQNDDGGDDDSDLADLLGGPSSTTNYPASGPYAKQQERVFQNYYQRHASMSCCDYISAYISV